MRYHGKRLNIQRAKRIFIVCVVAVLTVSWYFWPDNRPFVSICMPTKNRRAFIPTAIKIFQSQTYPQHLMEWIIVDDGDEPVGDLFKDIPNAKYYRTKPMALGAKRNFVHSKTSGDILVYMDDDDFYPPTRVEHAVERLMTNRDALIAGCDVMFIYYADLDKVYRFGPYWDNHATAGSFAFKRQLLQLTNYKSTDKMTEERSFLHDYTFPLIQLDTEQCILCISHSKNTFDKHKILKSGKLTSFTLEHFVKDEDIIKRIRETATSVATPHGTHAHQWRPTKLPPPN